LRKIGLAVWANKRGISSITSGGELIAEVEKDKGTSGEQLLILFPRENDMLLCYVTCWQANVLIMNIASLS